MNDRYKLNLFLFAAIPQTGFPTDSTSFVKKKELHSSCSSSLNQTKTILIIQAAKLYL
jgi:hypothetical protein